MHAQGVLSGCHAQERAAAEGCRQPGEAAAEASDVEGASPMDAFAWGSIVLGGPLDVSSEFERRLSVGAAIACRLRGAIRDQLGALEAAVPASANISSRACMHGARCVHAPGWLVHPLTVIGPSSMPDVYGIRAEHALGSWDTAWC